MTDSCSSCSSCLQIKQKKMKKTYMNPTTTVVMIEVAKMIAASDSLGIGDSVNSAAGAESRSDEDLWADE